ncbi:prophenin and tritrpticin precursor-like [Gracilinanus agilis]|uniref:prophenin and tritrpticin precursor-like n=1 Tax=Gracilinanus agilis TaxID=191870 RepID=UPI001CFEEC98|nr:prophenin and tritrpticin precursor-like [Gracilinanus agilis]
MGSLGRSLLVLCIALATATLSAQQRRGLSDQEALSLFLRVYNRDSKDNAIFKLRESRSVLREGRRLTLNAIIQETNCLKSENQNPDQCEFKERGLVRDCSGEMSPARLPRLIVIVCDSVPSQGSENQDALPAANHGKRKRRSDVESDMSPDTLPEKHRRRPFRRPPGFFPRPGPGPIFPGPRPNPNFPDPNFPNPNFPRPNFPRPNFPRPNLPDPNFPRPNLPDPNLPGPNLPDPQPDPDFP